MAALEVDLITWQRCSKIGGGGWKVVTQFFVQRCNVAYTFPLKICCISRFVPETRVSWFKENFWLDGLHSFPILVMIIPPDSNSANQKTPQKLHKCEKTLFSLQTSLCYIVFGGAFSLDKNNLLLSCYFHYHWNQSCNLSWVDFLFDPHCIYKSLARKGLIRES